MKKSELYYHLKEIHGVPLEYANEWYLKRPKYQMQWFHKILHEEAKKEL